MRSRTLLTVLLVFALGALASLCWWGKKAHSPIAEAQPATWMETSAPTPSRPATPRIGPVSLVGAPLNAPLSLEAVADFTSWTDRFISAAPDERAALAAEGMRLAAARRPVFKQLIQDDPRRALEMAVPVVVRQQLPGAILAQLEERVNRRADLHVYQGVPPPGEAMPLATLTHRVATFTDGISYAAHVYGERAKDVLGARHDALNGVAVDNQFAVNDEPVRVLEAGERPDAAKQIVTVCPVSGKTVIASDAAANPIPDNITVVETPEQVVYLCGGYHKSTFTTMLYAEGGTGGPIPITGILPAAPTPALGMVKVIFIPMTFADQNAVPTPEAKCYEIMRDVGDYYAKASYGKLTTIATVTPPIKLPHNEAWYVQKDTSNGGTIDGLGLEMTHAREEAKRLGFDYNDYDCTVLRLNGGARATGGWGGGSTVWIYGDSVGVTAHEIGHSFGLSHANFWDTAGTSAIGAGTNQEYGDQYDVMGGGSVPTDHYNAQAKNQVKWLPDNFLLDVTQSGTYRIYAFDQPILDPQNRYALRIVKDSQRTYWGEVRQAYNGSTSRPWADKGMLLGWRFPNGGASNIQLIDTTPGSSFAKDDAAISLGRTFSDYESGIHITTTSVSTTTPKYVDVVVNMGAFAGNHAPVLALTTSADVVPLNATVTFTATASDVDGDTLAYSWQHFGDTNVKIVSPNSAVITRTFTTAGTYVVTCTVSDMKGGSVTRSRLITVGTGNSRYTIAGRVTDGVAGIANVTMTANGANAVVTDSDGTYTIPNLTANTYTMTPLLYGYAFSETFENSVVVGPSFSGANFVAAQSPFVNIVASVPNAQEPGSGTAVVAGRFTLTRVGDISQDLLVNVNTVSGTATKGSDYTFTPDYVGGSQGFSTFTIPAGSATLDITVTPLSDAIAEGPETVILQLGPGSGYLVGSASQATVTIADDPADTTLPFVSVIATTPSTVENSGAPAVFTFTRTGATTASLTVNYTVGGTATAGSDYTALAGSMTIPIGASSAAVNVAPIDDAIPESLETVIVTTTANAAYLITSAASAATVSIIDDDVPTVTVVATDPNASEVDLSVPGAQPDTGTFLITRTGDTSAQLTVYYALSGPTTGEMALNGVDYEALSGVVVIPTGASSAAVTIIPRWDNLGEGTEYVTLNLGAGPTNYKLGAANSATVTILDAPGNLPTVEVIGFTTPAEPATNGAFRFTVRSPNAMPLVINYTISGTAIAGSDYTISGLNNVTLQGSVTITPSITAPVSQNVTVTVIDDALAEELENITLTINPAATYQTFAPTSSATLWLKDNEQPTVFADAHVSTYPPSVAENGSSVAFYLSRTGSTAGDLIVNYTMGGTATNGTDYDNGAGTALSGTATIPAGSSGVDVTVRPIDDAIFEGTETIILSLAAGAYGRGPSATLYLLDNETSAQTVAFSSGSAAGLESVGTVNIPVTLASVATAPVTVEYVVDTGPRSSSSTTNNTETLAYWVRVVRTGTNLTFFQSNDGATWTQRGGVIAVSMSSASYLAGLAVTSGQSGTADSAVIDNVSVTGLSAGGTSGAQVSADIGTVTPTGSDSLNAGVYSISAGGGAITSGGTTDAFHYVYFPITNSVNCTITARVVSQTGSTTLTRAGVMIRESTATNSRFAASLAQLNGTFLQGYRTTAGSTSNLLTYTNIIRPWWVRLQRTGDVFTASQSADGATWVTVGTPQTMALSTEVLAGLAVSARSDGTLSTATFDNVSLTGSPVLLGRTVGYVNAQGSDSLTGGVYTVIGSGSQIGGSEDECHFAAAPATGDFTFVARVLTQSGGNSNAQAGVMVRENGTYRVRSLYFGSVANAGTEFIWRNTSITNAFGDGIDFSLASGVLTFGIGEQTKNITLSILDDSLPEPDENVTLLLRNPNGAVLGAQTTFTYTIIDNDSPPALPSVGFSAATSSALENSGTATIAATLSAPATTNVTVNYAVTGGTATAGTDYTLAPGTLTFAPGETVKTFTIALIDDTIVEPSETIIIALSSPAGAILGSLNTHTFTILDDDFPTVNIVATDPNAAESGDTGTFTITRAGSLVGALTVNFTRSGTATSGSDYIAIASPGSVTIPDGQPSATITVTPIQDTINEGSETVILTLTASANYTLGASTTATVTIADDDRSTVTIVANIPNASETPGNPGQFTVTRTAPTTSALTVNLTIAGTATNGTDYTTIPSTVIIAAGQTSAVINVLPIDDLLVEGPEQVTISLNTGSYDIGASNFANVTIADNDVAPTLYITQPAAQGSVIPSGQGVIVGAFVSDDGLPQPVTLAWSQVSGPGTATFATPTAASSAVTFGADGVYVLRITANDGQFIVSDQVTIIVGSTIAPASWIAQDMSPSTQQRGQSTQIGNSYILTGMGAGYASTSNDAAHIMARQVNGDGTIVARLTATGGAATTPLAGVTIRDSLTRACNRAVLGYVPGTGLQFRTRTTVSTADTTTTQAGVTLPVWIKLQRTGSAINASYASDAAGSPGTWNTIGAATTINMADTITQIGLTATGNSSTAGVLCTATFDNVTLTPAPSGAALVSEDFGVSTPTASTFSVSGGTYTIGASGSMDGSGAFYGWQYQGDVMVTAKLASATSSALSAKSGIMIRESMDNTAGYIHLGRIPQGAFSGYIWRSLASGGGGGVPSFTGTVRWMRLIRQGNRVTAFHAADVSGSPGTWTQLGQPQTIIMSTPVLIGFAVDNSGGTAGVLNVCTFTNLSIVPLNTAPAIDLSAVPSIAVGAINLNATVSDDGNPSPPALTTQWSRAAGPGTVNFGNASAVNTTASFTQFGAYTLRLQADDTGVVTFRDKSLTYYDSQFQQWQAQNFAGDPNDPNAAPDADPDFDGLGNLIEYAFGSSPHAVTAPPWTLDTVTISTDRFLRLTIPKNPAATDVTYEVQATGNILIPANWSSTGLIIEQNTGTTLRVRDSVPMSPGGRRFMRAKVSR